MKKEQINSAISTLLETIAEQHQHLRISSNPVPLIELDIILSNIAKLYEQVNELKKINYRIPEVSIGNNISALITQEEKKPDNEAKEIITAEENLPPVVETVKPPIVSFVVRPSFVADAVSEMKEPTGEDFSNQTESRVEQQTITREEIIVTDRAETFQNEVTPVFQEEIKSQTPIKKSAAQPINLFDTITTVADKFEEQQTLRDKISKNQTDSSLAKKLQQKPVEDLKKSIGINEKFSFINELFEGDLNNYNKAIDTLNQSAGLNEAMLFIKQELIPRYGWEQTGKSYHDLADLLERRFMK